MALFLSKQPGNGPSPPRAGKMELLAPALLLCLNLFLFGTLAVYAGNSGEFVLPYSDVLTLLLPAGAGLLILLALPILFVPESRLRTYHSVLMLLAVATYIHGSLMRWNTGLLDGSALHLESTRRDLVDLAVWLVLAWLAWRYRGWLTLHGWKICAVLALFQVIGVSAQDFQHHDTAENPQLLPERLSELSSETNVIQIVLDGYQGSIFEHLLEEDSSLADKFPGFTFFRDALTASDVTYLSVPSLLTGRVFTNESTISAYLDATLDGRNLYSYLAERGYDVDVATPVWWNTNKPAFASYYRIPTPFTAGMRRSMALLLLDLSLFRQAPHFAKGPIYHDGSWLFSNWLVPRPEQQFDHFAHNSFMSEFTRRLAVGDEKPVYKFIHLVTPHAPLVAKADCSFAGHGLPYHLDEVSDQSRCTLRTVIAFLDRLKDLGVYDRALVIIHGDHGGGVSFPMRDKDGLATDSAQALHHVWGNPLPLVLVKPPGASGSLEISNRPVSLIDIPATVTDLLRQTNSFPGQSMYAAEAGDKKRVRTFYHSSMRRFRAAAKDRFDTFGKFEVRGSVYDVASWTEIMPAEAPTGVGELTYVWDTELRFGVGGNVKPFQDGGWVVSKNRDITWTMGNDAALRITFPQPSGPVSMHMTVKPLVVPGKLDRQRVNVFVNGKELRHLVLDNGRFGEQELTIPQNLFDGGGPTEFRFELPDATSPAVLGAGRDKRQLALAFRSIRFDDLGVD